MSDKELQDLGNARIMIRQWVDYYNCQRLHAGIRYLRPADYHSSDPDKLINIRKNKLDKARKQVNQRRLNEENRSKQKQSKSLICV